MRVRRNTFGDSGIECCEMQAAGREGLHRGDDSPQAGAIDEGDAGPIKEDIGASGKGAHFILEGQRTGGIDAGGIEGNEQEFALWGMRQAHRGLRRNTDNWRRDWTINLTISYAGAGFFGRTLWKKL